MTGLVKCWFQPHSRNVIFRFRIPEVGLWMGFVNHGYKRCRFMHQPLEHHHYWIWHSQSIGRPRMSAPLKATVSWFLDGSAETLLPLLKIQGSSCVSRDWCKRGSERVKGPTEQEGLSMVMGEDGMLKAYLRGGAVCVVKCRNRGQH